ncbi:MAG: ABC1 kinase family protein [Phycisphaerales bacterium]
MYAGGIHRTIKNVRRYGEIIEVLFRHGFRDIVSETGLDRWLESGKRLLLRQSAPQEHESRETRAQRLRRAMEELGPTFMKLGQVLSCRPDLIPEEWAEEFRNLQSNAVRLPFEEIERRLNEEFGDRLDEVIAWIDPQPLAAASMAQVHRARLTDGTPVVLKVLRPGIEDVTQSDMEILRTLAEFAESRFTDLGYSPTEVVDEFARELEREVDLTHEGRATDRLRAYFDDAPTIRFPEIYWSASTHRVLAMQEFKGTLLSSVPASEIPEDHRHAVVRHGAEAVLRQCLDLGFFHADPHPGNLFVLEDGAVGFIDCGMTGQIEARTAESLATLVLGVVRGDLDSVMRVVGTLSDAEPAKLEDRAVRADVRDFVAQFEHATVGRIDMPALLDAFFKKLRRHQLRCPADLVLLIKALTTIQSVARDLDPEFDLVEFASPHVERLVKRKYSVGAMRRRFERGMAEYAELAENLPTEVRQVLTQIRRNRLAVNLEHRGLTRMTQTIEHASRNIAFSLAIAGLVVGSSILVHADRPGQTIPFATIGIIGLALALVLTIGHVLRNRRWLRSRKD